MNQADIERIAAAMGYKAGFHCAPNYSHHAKVAAHTYVRVWHGEAGQRRYRHLGNIRNIAQLSEVELRSLIASKMSEAIKGESNVEQHRH